MFVLVGGVIAAVPPLEHIVAILLDRPPSGRLPKQKRFRMTVHKQIVGTTTVTRRSKMMFPLPGITHRIITLVFHRTLFRLAPPFR